MVVRKIYLLDTNTLSEPTKIKPDLKVLTELESKEIFCQIGAPTLYEMLRGINILPDGKRKEGLQDYFDNYVQLIFPVLNYDEHAAKINAEIYARMQKNGTPVELIDSQLASIALANNLILVTRNTKDFEPIQKEFSLCVENWYK